MDLRDRRVLVVGLGRSGLAAARLCVEQGAKVTVNDSREAATLEAALAPLGDTVTRVLGGHPTETFTRAELIVLSPGVPPLPALDAARAAGVPIIGELELGYRFIAAPVVAITGTNGKSTTTSLCGAMLAASGRPTFTGGNLGEPLCEAINRGEPGLAADGVAVLELSSFQLETVETFRARVAVLLNLSEDHLDRYPDFESYQQAKARIFERQQMDDWIVLNADPEQRRLCRPLARDSAARQVTFRSAPSRGTGAWIAEDDLCVRLPRQKVERYPRATLRLPGRHNTQNALAALLAARLAGASQSGCRAGMSAYEGLPHRMQLCGEHHDVRYYDDSKATNVGSVVGSLAGFERKVVLIAGGKDKGGDYAPLRPVLSEVCRHVVLIGAAADVMQRALEGSAPLSRASDMHDAVHQAAALAEPGDAVVLSPACSSYDMFRDFIERGKVFAAAVASLGEQA